jgi:ATP adenylyltransferase
LIGESRAEGCFLCTIGAGQDTDEALDLVVWRGESVYALLNRYPYANGHVMVAPYAHEGELDRLPAPVAAELMTGTRLIIRALRRMYAPQGFNVGLNLGAAAGAGYGDHVHFHVVPRWHGDTNFMTTTGGTRVVPEALDVTARRMRSAIASRPTGEPSDSTRS